MQAIVRKRPYRGNCATRQTATTMLFGRKKRARTPRVPTFSFCPASAGGLRLWVTNLPRTDLTRCIEQLLIFGNEINTLDAPLEEKLNALQIADEAISTVARGLSYQSRSSTSQIRTNDSQLAFSLLFGRLYYNTARQLIEAGTTNDHSDQCLTNACTHLSHAALLAMQRYQDPQPGVWILLHNCYNLSLTDCASDRASIDISSAYKSIVALACADPHQLTAVQIKSLYEAIGTAIAGVRISTSLMTDSDASYPIDNFHCCDTAIDSAPSLLGSIADAQHTGATLYFDFTLLKKILADLTISPELGTHIEKCYSSNQDRGFTRTSSAETLEICSGISALHFYLCGEQSFDSFSRRFTGSLVNEKNRFLSIETKKTRQKQDIWGGIYTNNWESAGFSGDTIGEEIQHLGRQQSDPTNFDSTEVWAINTSAGGYHLQVSHPLPAQFKPGDIVGLKHRGSERWLAGAIRWSRAEEGKRNLGIELLEPNPKPVGIKLIHSKHGTDFLPALAWASKNSEFETGQHATVLFSNTHLASKTAAILIDEHQEKRVVLTQCEHRTVEYCCYQFRLQDTDSRPLEKAGSDVNEKLCDSTMQLANETHKDKNFRVSRCNKKWLTTRNIVFTNKKQPSCEG